MPFEFTKLKIPEVILVESKVFPDERGFFSETFKESTFNDNGIKTKFVQDNYSHSVKGTLRGLHFQKAPMAQGKLVMAIKGEIFDVAVDIRQNSPTYKKWVGEILSERNHRSLYVPRGFAHGFCVLSDEADIVYKVDNEFSPENDSGIIWNDPEVNVKWPIDNPLVSEKDQQQPLLKNADNNFVFQ